MTHMSHCMGKNHGDESGEGIQLMQQKTIECWPCQEEGHKANECLNCKKKEQSWSKLKAARVKWSASCEWILNDNTSGAFDRSVLDK